ncbi:unnamed protein product [Brassica oleracea]|uniref:(rape) hypothetical protein n=1 Tax=Brassica napus TaxID=3708 RepID=A0A816U5M6_BRANA|nr:unnamed protein product [Brassica napus]
MAILYLHPLQLSVAVTAVVVVHCYRSKPILFSMARLDKVKNISMKLTCCNVFLFKVGAKDQQIIQASYATILKAHVTALKKRERK